MIASRMAATATIPIFNSDQASDRVLGINYSEGLRPSDSLHALSRAASSARSVRVARFAPLARVLLRRTRPHLRPSDSLLASLRSLASCFDAHGLTFAPVHLCT